MWRQHTKAAPPGGLLHVKTVRSTRAHMTYRKHLVSRNLEKKLENTKRRLNFAGVKTVLKAWIARLFCSICGWLKAGCMSVELFCALFGVTRWRQRNIRQQMARAAKKRLRRFWRKPFLVRLKNQYGREEQPVLRQGAHSRSFYIYFLFQYLHTCIHAYTYIICSCLALASNVMPSTARPWKETQSCTAPLPALSGTQRDLFKPRIGCEPCSVFLNVVQLCSNVSSVHGQTHQARRHSRHCPAASPARERRVLSQLHCVSGCSIHFSYHTWMYWKTLVDDLCLLHITL